MKTTHEKLLTSLLALGLTSSAGLYAQSTFDIFEQGTVGNGISFYSPINEDIDGDGILDRDELAAGNGDAVFNNGGTGLDANGVQQGALLNEFIDGVDYNGDGVIEATAEAGLANLYNEDFDGDGLVGTLDEDLNGNFDGNFTRGEDSDGDGRLDVNEFAAGNGDAFLNNGGTGAPLAPGGPATFLPGEAPLLNEFIDGVDYNGDGVIEATAAGGLANLYNEDINGDGQLDSFDEDQNGNGVLDIANRTNLEAINPLTGNRQDLDILVENGLFVNGEMVATENYVDAADARLQAQIDTNVRDIAKNREDIETNTRGIAMVAALQHTTVLPGMTNALDISAAHFEGETGMALNYARRINDNVQINFGAASTTDFEESVIKAGVGIQW